MFCFVDFRNRPQYKYTFHSREKAREYLRKIQNNPLGATIIHADGRREYFDNGLPSNIAQDAGKNFQIWKGCHIKYKIRPLAVLDGIAPNNKKTGNSNTSNWKVRATSPLFMLGNLKFSACLLMISFVAFSSVYFFQKNLGQSAAAEEVKSSGGIVLGASDDRRDPAPQDNGGKDAAAPQLAADDVVMNLIARIDDEKHADFAQEILTYVKGRPMEDMAPYIAKQPRMVAAFIVGIAMKESKFGTYSPKLDGRDCHNYWGFKGGGTTTAGGYTCFGSPEDAIQVVGKRIAKLVDGGRTSPSAMVVWKCGSTCSWDNPENVRSWIADVGINFYKLNNKQSS